MDCRPGCGAWCVAPSITTPFPGVPRGKPAGTRCVNLTPEHLCRLWGSPAYPPFCRGFRPSPDACGEHPADAMVRLTVLEAQTVPDSGTLSPWERAG